jgi:hypothetical protein
MADFIADEERRRRMLARIVASADGPDLIGYLGELSEQNYKAFKMDGAEMNEFHKGYAFAIDNLLELLRECAKPISTPREPSFG